jgi:hypothetical protein
VTYWTMLVEAAYLWLAFIGVKCRSEFLEKTVWVLRNITGKTAAPYSLPIGRLSGYTTLTTRARTPASLHDDDDPQIGSIESH